MKFILNKCKVIQLGKYNLIPWRLGERHLESNKREWPEGQQITAGFGMGVLGRAGAEHRQLPGLSDPERGRFPVVVPLSATLPTYASCQGPKDASASEKPGIFVWGQPGASWGYQGIWGM